MTAKCDHPAMWFWNDPESIRYSDVVEECFESSQTVRAKGNGVKAIDYVDGRKAFAHLFKFCPDCGVMINWESIKRQLTAQPGQPKGEGEG